MRPPPARLALLVTALLGCRSGFAARATRVDQELRVTADGESRGRWFATLHALQRLLATADARRIEVLGPLQVMLCRPPDASLPTIASAAQARLALGGFERTGTRLRRLADSEQALTRWLAAVMVAPDDAVEREALLAVEETLSIERLTSSGAQAIALPTRPPPTPEPRCNPGAAVGSEGADGATVLAQLARVLRRSAAQALLFQRALSVAGELRAQWPAVSAGAPPALGAELSAADRVLTGIVARATMHLHESARTEQWARGVLTPEGEAAPEEPPEGPTDGVELP